MAGIDLLDPKTLKNNPENPRLIFRATELAQLEESIRSQGILVPLTVYEDARGYTILDGERRWRCALKLQLPKVPAIIQPKPDRLQNIMMMFAIHNARRDWDPLPTAYKLRQLQEEYTHRQGRPPTETELAQMASISRGEVRRLQRLLGLPEHYQEELMTELEKPRSEQLLTVDHVLEATKGAAALRRREIIDEREEEQLRRAIVDKFRHKVLTNTVEPRQLARIARAVDREEITSAVARREAHRLIRDPGYTIERAFRASVEQADFEHSLEQLVDRISDRLGEHRERGYEVSPALAERLRHLNTEIRRFLR